MRRIALSVALYVTLALLFTWPLPLQLGSRLPLGTLSSPTVPLFNLWTLEWNADRFAHGLTGYWDAPIFHPERGAFALSEPQPLTGLLFTLLQPLLGSVAGYAVVLLALLVTNALAARRLLLVSGVSEAAALATGVLALALPFAFKELGVLQLLALWPVLLTLAELCLLQREPSVAALLRLGLWICAALLSCLYYALFLSVFLVLSAPLLLRRSWLQRRTLLAGTAAIALVAACAWPLVAAQHAAVGQHTRSASALRHGSALARDYVRVAPRSLPARAIPALASRNADARVLGPGIALFSLALLGMFLGARRASETQRRWLRWCAACALLAVLLSFGTRLQLFGVCPYEIVFMRHWPGFAQLRSAYRFAAFAQLFLLVPAGYGLDYVHTWSQRQRADHGHGRGMPWLALAVMLVLVEVVRWDQPLTPVSQAALNEPWVSWLAQHPGGALAMVPPALSDDASAFVPTTVGMLQGLRHGHPLVNGYSGFFPARSDRLASKLRRFPSATCLSALRAVPVRYVLADNAWLARQPTAATPRALHVVLRTPTRTLYEITPP